MVKRKFRISRDGNTVTRGEAGQALVEAMLLMALFLGFVFFVSKEFKERKILSNFVNQPWKQLDGMVANGYWGSREKTNELHPNLHNFHISLRGENARL